MNVHESPLIQAILDDDHRTIAALAGKQEAVIERNWLGFNALEIALFFDKQTALDHLQPGRQKRKVKWSTNQKMSMKEFEKHFGVHYLTHLKFKDYATFVKAIKRSWAYRKTVLGKEMRQLANVYSLEFYVGMAANVRIEWIDASIGHGLFAGQDFRENTFIAEYTGEVSPLDPIQGPGNPYLLRYPRPFFSLNFLQVDAEHMGNETRFINHSDKPNLLPGIALDRGVFRSFFVTKRPILKGEQLTFNYGRKYWRHFEKPLPI